MTPAKPSPVTDSARRESAGTPASLAILSKATRAALASAIALLVGGNDEVGRDRRRHGIDRDQRVEGQGDAGEMRPALSRQIRRDNRRAALAAEVDDDRDVLQLDPPAPAMVALLFTPLAPAGAERAAIQFFPFEPGRPCA